VNQFLYNTGNKCTGKCTDLHHKGVQLRVVIFKHKCGGIFHRTKYGILKDFIADLLEAE